MRLCKAEWKSLLLIGILGPCATTLLLYSSYEYCPIGIATVLHFMYPVLVTVAGLLFFHERFSAIKVAAVLAAALGVSMFFQSGVMNLRGIFLALLSSMTYAFYMVGLEHSVLNQMCYFKLSFYFCMLSAIVSGAYGAATGVLNLNLTPTAWFYSLLISLLVSVGAVTLFQAAIILVGASTTAILSTLEPITSVLLSWAFLSEQMSIFRIFGCVCILFSVGITTLVQVRSTAPQ